MRSNELDKIWCRESHRRMPKEAFTQAMMTIALIMIDLSASGGRQRLLDKCYISEENKRCGQQCLAAASACESARL